MVVWITTKNVDTSVSLVQGALCRTRVIRQV